MEWNDPIRNRRAGFLGVAVATLLSPGGKLFSSALAAATIAGVVSVNMLPKEEKTSQSAPVISHTSSANIDNELLNVGDLGVAANTSDTLSAETLASDQYAAQAQAYGPTASQSGIILTAQMDSPGSLAYVYDAPNGGGPPSPPSLIPSGPKSPQPDFGPPEAGPPVGPPETLLTPIPPEVIEENGPPKVLPPPIVIMGPNDGGAPPETLLPLEPNDFPPDGFPPASGPGPLMNPQFQPLIALAAVDITEPPTLGLLVLGLFSLGLYRTKRSHILKERL